MPRQSWRKKVRSILPNGRVIQETKKHGEHLLETGQAELVPKERRFTVRLIDVSNYKEELKYVSGRPLKATHNRTNLGTFLPGGKRCRPPRQQISEVEKEFRDYKRKKCA